MPRLKHALPALALALLVASSASAQITGRPIEVSGQGGLFVYDIRNYEKKGAAFGATLGWRPFSLLTLEGQAVFGPSKQDTFPNLKHNFTQMGLDLRWNLRAPEERVVPYLITGFGYGASRTVGHPPEKLQRGSGSLGFGVLWSPSQSHPRTYLRLQARDVLFSERELSEFTHHLAFTAGVHLALFGRVRDQDLDGVRDWLDQCPDTPIGCTVNGVGCPSDADGDSVCDGVDKCPNTPKGCKVDRNGCPIDSDGDGVCDGIDTCPDTPKGCTVNATGCPADADSDGVCDGVDVCPNTPRGCVVNAEGCPADADSDGVCDAFDKCPNTPLHVAVGPTGCPVEVGRYEEDLFDTGVIRVHDVAFVPGTDSLPAISQARLDSVGVVLQQYPALRIQVGAHVDDRGTEQVQHSLAQAKAVVEYMKGRFPLINWTSYTLRGYGSSQPIAPKTPAGRALNRRIEFKVLNPDQLKAERERRGLK